MKMNVEFRDATLRRLISFMKLNFLQEVLLMTWTMLSECFTTDVFDNSSPNNLLQAATVPERAHRTISCQKYTQIPNYLHLYKDVMIERCKFSQNAFP